MIKCLLALRACHFYIYSIVTFGAFVLCLSVEPSVLFFFGPVFLKTLPLPKSFAYVFFSFLLILILETLWRGVASCRNEGQLLPEREEAPSHENNQGDQLSQLPLVHTSLVLRWQLLDKHSVKALPRSKLARQSVVRLANYSSQKTSIYTGSLTDMQSSQLQVVLHL